MNPWHRSFLQHGPTKRRDSLIRCLPGLAECLPQSVSSSHSWRFFNWFCDNLIWGAVLGRREEGAGVRASGSNKFGLWCAATPLAVIHCLLPYALTPLVVSTGGNMTAADVQHRHEWSHLLCSAASANSLHSPLFNASLCRHLALHIQELAVLTL